MDTKHEGILYLCGLRETIMPKPEKSQEVKSSPHSVESERATLGSILLDNSSLAVAAELIGPNDFFSEANKVLFSRMLTLSDAGRTVDLVTLNDELRKEGTLEKVGGASYLASLTDGVPSGSHTSVTQYARIVKEKSQLRQLINSSNNVISRCFDQTDEPTAIADLAFQELNRITGDGVKTDFESIREMMKGGSINFDAMMGDRKSNGMLATGILGLDDLLSGIHPGELTVLAGRPSTGKSALAFNTACYASSSGHPIGIFSLEMSRQAILERMLCSEGRINGHNMRAGFCSQDDYKKAVEALARLTELPIYINDSAAITVRNLQNMARRLKARHKVEMIIVDYLQLMTAGRKTQSEVEEVTYISKSLKALAKDEGVAVVALSQLSRDSERGVRRKPRLSDLRGSGGIEQDADCVIFIHVPRNSDGDPEIGTTVDLIIGKSRNGPTGIVKALFLKPYVRFENLIPGSGIDDGGDTN